MSKQTATVALIAALLGDRAEDLLATLNVDAALAADQMQTRFRASASRRPPTWSRRRSCI